MGRVNPDRVKGRIFSPFFKGNETLQQKIDFISENIIIARGTIYHDWMASALAFRPIERRINSILGYYANTHSSSSAHARLMDELYIFAKERIRQILGLNGDFCIVANMPNASAAFKKAHEILGVYCPPKLKRALMPEDMGVCISSQIEHHSNEIPWRESVLRSVQVPLDENLLFDLNILRESISKLDLNDGDIKIGAFNVASNVTGMVLPMAEISHLLKESGFIRFYDMSASSSHMKVDPDLYDLAVFAAHKFLGGVNASSFLVFRKELYDSSIPPTFGGGGVVRYSNSVTHDFHDDIQRREECGSVNVLSLVKTALSLSLLDEVGFEYIALREKVLREVLIYELKTIPAIDIYGHDLPRAILSVSFNAAMVSPYDLASVLSDMFGIQVRAGCSCAGSYGHRLLGLSSTKFSDLESRPGWLRLSPHFSSNIDDIKYLVDCIRKGVSMLRCKSYYGKK